MKLKQGFWAKHLMICLSLVSFGCGGDATSPGAVGGGETGPASAGILGIWEGLYISKTLGLNQQESTAVVTFEGETESQGRFTINLAQIENASVKGVFKNFAGKSLILNVEESSVSTLGLTGATTDLPYELTGHSLQLGNDRVTLKLTRKGDGPKGPGKNPAEKPTGLYGRWKCNDALAKIWSVNIRSENRFSIDVTEPNNGQSYLWLDGRVAKAAQGENSLLIVEKSSNPKYKGMQMKAELQSETALILLRSQLDDQKPSESVSCSKV
jgi:hypothetical protein